MLSRAELVELSHRIHSVSIRLLLQRRTEEDVKDCVRELGAIYHDLDALIERDRNQERSESPALQIIVNGIALDCRSKFLSYQDVIDIAGYQGSPSVTFHGAAGPSSGVMAPGDEIRIQHDTTFNVAYTNRA